MAAAAALFAKKLRLETDTVLCDDICSSFCYCSALSAGFYHIHHQSGLPAIKVELCYHINRKITTVFSAFSRSFCLPALLFYVSSYNEKGGGVLILCGANECGLSGLKIHAG